MFIQIDGEIISRLLSLRRIQTGVIMNISTSFALIIFLCICISASGQVKDYVPRSEDEAQLIALENEWADAAVKRDATRLSRIFADDLSWIEDTGYRNKEQVMHRYMVEVQELVIELRDVRVRIFGNVAIVQSHVHVKKTVNGQLVENDHTDLDVFAKRNGRWQLVAE
jgi:ketosteroid isomerase-like protein